MRTSHLFITVLLMAAWPMLLFSQNKRISKNQLSAQFAHFTNSDSSLTHVNYFDKMATRMGLPDVRSMVLAEETSGKNGWQHFKFQQMHAGLPIVAGIYILHEKNGWVQKANGHFIPNPSADASPKIQAETAVQIGQKEMDSKTFSNSPEPTLCFIDAEFPKISEVLRLAYQVDLTGLKPFEKQRFYIDAHNGKVLTHYSLIEKQAVPSQAVTKYYGTVSVLTDSIGPNNFVLQDPTRGVSVVNDNQLPFTNTSSKWNLTNSKQDEVALDAHFCASRYYDMMVDVHNWSGLDGNGKALIVKVHQNEAGNVNAFWDGIQSNFGDGNCLNGPLTTLEVVGHEFTHGMIDYTSKLIYDSESGAINESLADMFGKALERNTTPADFSWDLGHSFLLSPDAKPFRVMDDPKSVEMPAFYGGDYWNANNGVHTNSSIGNLWFSLITDGKQGINEANESFNVAALGMTKASQIAFISNKNYLTPNSDYTDFYLNSMDAAEEIFGIGASEKAVVEEAWKAVGLPSSNVSGFDFDLSVYTEGFDESKDCGSMVTKSLTIQVTNTGKLSYLPSVNGKVIFSCVNLADYTIDLTEKIQPGEVVSFVVDNWFTQSQPGNYAVYVTLNAEDENSANDFSYAGFSLLEFPNSDIAFYADFSESACFSPTLDAFFYIYNNSCATIQAGSVGQITIEDGAGEVLWSQNKTFLVDFQSGAGELFNLPINLQSGTLIDVIANFKFFNDPNLLNNSSFMTLQTMASINGNYLNKFSNDNELNTLITANTNLSTSLVTYLGKSYVGSIGTQGNFSDFVPCPNLEDNFNNTGYDGNVNTQLTACVDFSSVQNSVISFDLMQFRNSYAVGQGYPYSSMLQVKWTGNESGKQIIFGQTEGQLVHHELDLPPFFKGEIDLRFYTEMGSADLKPSDFQTDDVLLMDNLRLKINSVGVSESLVKNEIMIAPNPAQESIEIKSAEPLNLVELTDLNGKLLKREIVDGNLIKIDLSDLENGVFFLRMQNTAGQWTARKVVKMRS